MTGARLAGELATLARFGVVGVVATLVHYGAALLAARAGAPLLLANLVGFLVAFSVSFLGHHHWTFRPAEGPARGLRASAARFMVVAGSSFLFSTVVLAGLVAQGRVSAPLALGVAVLVVPLVNFVAARGWAFAHPGER